MGSLTHMTHPLSNKDYHIQDKSQEYLGNSKTKNPNLLYKLNTLDEDKPIEHKFHHPLINNHFGIKDIKFLHILYSIVLDNLIQMIVLHQVIKSFAFLNKFHLQLNNQILPCILSKILPGKSYIKHHMFWKQECPEESTCLIQGYIIPRIQYKSLDSHMPNNYLDNQMFLLIVIIILTKDLLDQS